jgi:hypothetical protein
MPFRNGARIVLKNDGIYACSLQVSITHAPLTKPISQLGRFHAKWHRNAFLPADSTRAPDWTMLTTQGRGRFCGVHLHVWNTYSTWWGEGDEKFFVDGEKFPSSFGTGSEDYFGYAWCNPSFFENAYHNQPLSQGYAGHTSNNRWQIADNVPFQTSFEGCIEKYLQWVPGLDPNLATYALTAYWYLNEGGTDPYQAYTLSDRLAYFMALPTGVERIVYDGEFGASQLESRTNPFTMQTTISYLLNRTSNIVRIQIFDYAGKLVYTLTNGPMEQGKHAAIWNAARMPSGTFVVRLEAMGGPILTKHILLLK